MGLNDVINWVMSDAGVQTLSTLVKFLVVVVGLVQIPAVMVWVERRVPALMQRRKGPNRVGVFKFRLWGLMQSAADAVKLIWKEEVVPEGANKTFFHIAPIFAVFPAFLIGCAIPYGNTFAMGDFKIPLTVIRLDVGFLFILAISSMAVYAVTLAGWASNSKYTLLGALRASAQMISYEIPLGMSLIPIVIIYGTLDLNSIVVAQGSNPFHWGIVPGIVSFMLFFICMFAETNRAPFDLAEGESELVAGFHTEMNSAKFAAIFLAEYVNMFVLSALCATVFFGGWQIPFISYDLLLSLLSPLGMAAGLVASLIGVVVLLIKASIFMFIYVWVRWTLPRFRYDQLMSLGWKFMLPIGLANILIVAVADALLGFK